ncbi:ErfK/YbiS/YcfS/YnhG family protein [Candidatus Omnitrophus magneticus]|uniref:ErfK/YbiS/YcfS/YnhG family protein n=1 Tax=Candidatus Omnitrophus magneticus TaxID=1609969 RepID=A0A0F0CRN7_9BACT|nr:ErfK/YbiS/YcfS/YnhG family protein [Candidatus Omnitrophus magneticus]
MQTGEEKKGFMNNKFILGIAGVLVLFVTMISFVSLRSAVKPVGYFNKEDKVELLYKRASDMIKEGKKEDAVKDLNSIVEKYPNTSYAEQSLRSLAEVHAGEGNSVKSAEYYQKLLASFPNVNDAEKIRNNVGKVNVENIVTNKSQGDVTDYTVATGDHLYGIAKKFNTTVALIKKMNNLNSDVIRVGQKLKINSAVFSILVNKTQKILILKKNGNVVKTYPVAVGKDNCTPAGVFNITDKMVKPAWTNQKGQIIQPDSKEYEIGERWMAISVKGYGIHGTNDENVIGKAMTSGCVRMHNVDVIELYDIVPKGTAVEIIEG